MHLPIKTDAFIAEEVAKRVAEKIEDELPVLVMPTIWSGYSMKAVSRWPGTIRLKPETFINIIVNFLENEEPSINKDEFLGMAYLYIGLINIEQNKLAEVKINFKNALQ